MSPQELRWLAEARAGSSLAYSRLVGACQAQVRGFLRRILGQGWAEADDVAQEVFVAAWQRLGQLREPEKFRLWLMGLAWRRAQDVMRHRLRAARRDRDWLEHLSLPDGVNMEDRMALDQAMARLTPEARACVALSLGEGFSHNEVAAALNLPLGTVKSHVARGKARLLTALGGCG